MTIRSTQSSVEFRAPFKLAGHDELLPAGIYQIDTDEEAFEATERTVYRRIETRLQIQTLGKTVHRRVDPSDLDAALRRDQILATAVRPDPGTASDEVTPGTPQTMPARPGWSSIFTALRSWIRALRSPGRRSSS